MKKPYQAPAAEHISVSTKDAITLSVNNSAPSFDEGPSIGFGDFFN